MFSKQVVPEEKLADLGKFLRKKGKRIVFTTGAYDLIHSGHAHFLAEARTWGDALVVGVSGNSLRRKRRGSVHPLVDQEQRAETLSCLRPVDYVTVVENPEMEKVLADLQPNVFYTIKEDWRNGVRSKKELTAVEEGGGQVIRADRLEPFVSSSEIVERLAHSIIKKELKSFFGDDLLGFSNNHHPPYIDLGEQAPRNLLGFAYLASVISWQSLESLREGLKEQGKSIAFVSGSYDLVHVGHTRFIEKAASWADTLVVGIPSDEVIQRMKGPSRPVVGELSRAELLRFFRPVDYVTIFPQKTVAEVLKLLRPDIFQTVDEAWNNGYKESKEYKIIKKYGGEVKLVGRQAPFVSSHVLIEQAAGAMVREIFKKCLAAKQVS